MMFSFTQGFFVDFLSFNFSKPIQAGIITAGYQTPTPIQSRAIPPVLEGRDVMGLAQTGTGKTAAFALPILERLLSDNARKRGPARVLVLAPTRELALQIHESFITLGKQTGFRSAAVFGGVGFNPQVKALRNASIIVACPGRLLDMMDRGAANLKHIDTLVLDEADRMLDMGFLPDIKRILARLPEERQNLLFSATMPRDIRRLSDDLLTDPVEVQVANTRPADTVKHALYPIPQHLKSKLLLALLKRTEHESVLVFTRTKHKAKYLADRLNKKGFSATSLQGNLSQGKRQQALDGFKNKKYKIMVATDIAARGIDCSCISHVINYDMPDSVETYTHRIGRTGRAEATGEALTFLCVEDQHLVRHIERALGKKIDRKMLSQFDYSDTNKPSKAAPQARARKRNTGDANNSGKTSENKPRKKSASEKNESKGRFAGNKKRRPSRGRSSQSPARGDGRNRQTQQSAANA